MKAGLTKSCGCLGDENRANRIKFNTKHGQGGKNKTRTFNIWVHIRSRCGNPNNPFCADYGGRGIKVCDRWLESFETFLKIWVNALQV